MKLLLNESPLQLQRTVAVKLGLNEAIFLQQLHFRTRISKNIREGHKWVYNTYENWRKEFPFWSVNTIIRIINKLEKEGYIISGAFNKMKIDKTKWYRVNYEHADLVTMQSGQTNHLDWVMHDQENVENDFTKMGKAITKELKTTTKNKDSVEKNLDVIASVIDYLNLKVNKQFKCQSKAARSLLNARIEEGYTLDDFKAVIDSKTAQWLHDPRFRKYLQPSTLFHATKFENYMNEVLSDVPIEKLVEVKRDVKEVSYQSPILIFGEGESVDGL
ncbi:conserved phage C-terminal domain-containing protein [Sporosarcina sp. GW1-11]|uniref:conserved phage C-terminal domain-containing protein n=1 Tax=Sporosarcina sp. GW1-11 TaxID=2899126 RepID=UPI00294C835F|nr:conserved phage C-terminal domain-containing protein [Sporosarcina sp. GW1-11]MDV6379001.1 conserved phage C-terminal domain-containing protein [Sporosarcina sp. GW1-11]